MIYTLYECLSYRQLHFRRLMADIRNYPRTEYVDMLWPTHSYTLGSAEIGDNLSRGIYHYFTGYMLLGVF